MINNYNNSKIYALRSDDTEKIYIGTTTQNLSKKLSELRTSNSNLISEYFRKYGDVYIELIEYYPCKSKEELNQKTRRTCKRKHKYCGKPSNEKNKL